MRMSLNQDVSHGFDVFVSIISSVFCLVSARVGVIRISSSTKPNSGVRASAIIFVVTKDTDSCFGMTVVVANCIEPFLVTVSLQGALGTRQRLPRVTTQ